MSPITTAGGGGAEHTKDLKKKVVVGGVLASSGRLLDRVPLIPDADSFYRRPKEQVLIHTNAGELSTTTLDTKSRKAVTHEKDPQKFANSQAYYVEKRAIVEKCFALAGLFESRNKIYAAALKMLGETGSLTHVTSVTAARAMSFTEYKNESNFLMPMTQRGEREDLYEGWFAAQFYQSLMHAALRVKKDPVFLEMVNGERGFGESGFALLLASKNLASTSEFKASPHEAHFIIENPLPIVYAEEFLENQSIADSCLVCFLLPIKITDKKNFTYVGTSDKDYDFTSPVDKKRIKEFWRSIFR